MYSRASRNTDSIVPLSFSFLLSFANSLSSPLPILPFSLSPPFEIVYRIKTDPLIEFIYSSVLSSTEFRAARVRSRAAGYIRAYKKNRLCTRNIYNRLLLRFFFSPSININANDPFILLIISGDYARKIHDNRLAVLPRIFVNLITN